MVRSGLLTGRNICSATCQCHGAVDTVERPEPEALVSAETPRQGCSIFVMEQNNSKIIINNGT